MPPPAAVASGTAFALAAGLMWGLVFIAPLLLPDYPPALLSVARYLAFGLIALPLAWWDRTRLAELTRADWTEAAGLALVGNLLYYLFLAAAIQRAGGPLPTMIIGTLPVVIAVSANLRRGRRDERLPWARLGPSLLLIGAGIALVQRAEAAAAAGRLTGQASALASSQMMGVGLALAAVACWTWYPIRNADWLRAHADRSPRAWATAQGIATLPLAAIGYALFRAWSAGDAGGFASPLGPSPALFVALMLAIGLFASWLGTLCWNEASQRLPPALAGQLIVFETLAALGYAYALRGAWPPAAVWAGVALLVTGVAWALRPTVGAGPTTTGDTP